MCGSHVKYVVYSRTLLWLDWNADGASQHQMVLLEWQWPAKQCLNQERFKGAYRCWEHRQYHYPCALCWPWIKKKRSLVDKKSLGASRQSYDFQLNWYFKLTKGWISECGDPSQAQGTLNTCRNLGWSLKINMRPIFEADGRMTCSNVDKHDDICKSGDALCK